MGGISFKTYEDLKALKLFVADVGLLGCMTGLHQHTLLDGNEMFTEFLKANSLKTYREKFNPPAALRISMADYKKEDRFINLPLYAVEIVVRQLNGIC